MKKERGITLVALVITVIIMLILAGVALSLITGEEGLFARANHTARLYENATKDEKSKVDEIIDELNIYTGLTELPKTETEFTQKENGVIDIVWLDTSNNVIGEPLSPQEHLGELTAVKYSGGVWINADANNGSNEWYRYEAQVGNTEAGGTSQWANAKIEKDGKTAYFVWIPRYAYKITYFDTADNANAYRANGSTEGIIGYSTIQGIIDVTGEEAKVVEGTEPTNVTGRVMSKEYADYIPHPAFEFDGAKAGIWVGKYESSGTTSSSEESTNITTIEIREGSSSLTNVTASAMFDGSKAMKDTYGLSGDTHMMKNIEWGAVAYLTESKYGRNGVTLTQNKDNDRTTGGESGDITKNKLQSSTGNEYGIYDMSGGAIEYVAGYISNETVKNNGYNDSIVGEEVEAKYRDVYAIGATDDGENNYQANKGMKGDAVYETSTSYTGRTGWHGNYTLFPNTTRPLFMRSGRWDDSAVVCGVFYFGGYFGYNGIRYGFRVVLI